MKKIILFTLTLVIVFSFISCNTSYGEHFITNVYPNADFALYPFSSKNDNDNIPEYAYEITDEATLKLFNDLFITVTEYFNVTIEPPQIKRIDDQDQSYGGFYNRSDGTIYINTSCDLPYFETIIVHEIIHYISDGNIYSGIVYTLDIQGDIAGMGSYLNEGLTEYFAQEIKHFNYVKNELDVYYFESYVAKILSTIIGEEKLKEIYLNNSYQELKDLFNKHLDTSFGLHEDDINLDAFDFFCMQVDAYSTEYDEYVKGLRMNSILDELLIIAKGEGKEKEVKKIINEFGNNLGFYLPGSYIY